MGSPAHIAISTIDPNIDPRYHYRACVRVSRALSRYTLAAARHGRTGGTHHILDTSETTGHERWPCCRRRQPHLHDEKKKKMRKNGMLSSESMRQPSASSRTQRCQLVGAAGVILGLSSSSDDGLGFSAPKARRPSPTSRSSPPPEEGDAASRRPAAKEVACSCLFLVCCMAADVASLWPYRRGRRLL